jgi:hypothetical protein
VSGKYVGKGSKLELVDGPRGRAIRVTAGAPGGPLEGLKLAEPGAALAIEEGKPFTLALWARTDDAWAQISPRLLHGPIPGKDKGGALLLFLQPKGIGLFMNDGPLPSGVKPLLRGTRELTPTREWVHLALTRDEKGNVYTAVNGDVKALGSENYTGTLRFTAFSLGWSREKPFTVEFDEFCLFDRVLTDAEIKKLAGRAK